MNCTIRAKNDQDMQTLRQYLSVHSAGAGKFDTGAGMYLPRVVREASPQRWVHLQQPSEVHDELFPQFAMNRDLSKLPPPEAVNTAVAVG